MANRVRVQIDGDDRLSPVLDRIGGKLNGLRGEIRDGVLQANLLGGAIGGAMNLGQRVVGAFTGSLQSARAAQGDIVKSVGALASAIGIPYEQANALNQEITNGLADYAAALPGSTDEYVSLFRVVSDNVAGMNKEMNNGAFNAEQYKEQVTELVSKFRALGEGTTFLQQANAIGDLISGGRTVGSLDQLEYFRNNPLLMSNLAKLSEQMGKDLNEMTGGERLDVVVKALNMSLTDDTIDRLGGTIDSQVASFMTAIVDPNVGIFGMLRDVDKATSGQQTAIQAITEVVTAVIGSDGLLFTLGQTLQDMGIQFADPMLQLRNAALWAAAKIRFVSTVLRRYGNLFESGAEQAGNFLGNQIRYFFGLFNLQAMSDRLAGLVNQGIALAGQVDWSLVGGAIGLIAANALDAAANFVLSIDYGALLGVALEIGKGAIVGIASFLRELDLKTMLAIAVPVIGGILVTSVVVPVVTALGGLILSVLATTGVGAIVAGFAAAIGGVPLILVGAAVLSLGLLAKAIADNWQTVIDVVKQVGSAIGNYLMGGLKIIGGVITGNAALARNGLEQVFASLRAVWDMIRQAIDGFRANFGFQTSGVARSTGALDAAEARFQSAVASQGGTTVAGATPSASPAAAAAPRRTGIDGAASGFFPRTGLGGLLQAAIAESRAMPSGAGLLVANTSEAVLNSQQQAAIAGLLGRRAQAPAAASAAPSAAPAAGGINLGGVTIVQQPGENADALLRRLMVILDEQFRSYEAGFLA